MVFNSLHFAAFFVVVLVLYAFLRRNLRARNIMLLIASYYFYGSWDWRFLSLLIISTVLDYTCGLGLNVKEATKTPPPHTHRDRLFLLASIVGNLGILGFFKYYNFFVDNAVTLLGTFGLHVQPRMLNVILPLGISFYTFQTMCYTIDVYRGKLPTERNLLNFALYVTFFPQLVAGPIERATNLLPQMRTVHRVTWDDFSMGFYLIGLGLFKKVVLADNAAHLVDRIYSMQDPPAGVVLMGLHAFALQIYCDFAGYSDIAIGVARCMGFRLMQNFNCPYFAVNPSDFWQRWHISLSSWLRDYVFFSMGGSKKGPLRAIFNTMVTMALVGLWHGAAWTFVLWGVYNGVLLIGHRMLRPVLKLVKAKGPVSRRVWLVARMLACYHMFIVGTLLFRGQSVRQAWDMFSSFFARPWLGLGALPETELLGFGVGLCFLMIFEIAQYNGRDQWAVMRFPVLARAAVYATMMLSFIWWGEYGGDAFIYFQF